MRSFATVAIFCIALGGAVWTQQSHASASNAGIERFQGQPQGEGKPIKPFSFLDAEGRKTDLSDFSGRMIVLNLWATWCTPCVTEMPSLDRLQATLGGRGFQVVALSLDRNGRARVEPFLKKLDVRNLALYLDPSGTAMSALDIKALPTTLLIGPDGQELGRVEGAVEWDSPAVVSFLRKHLGVHQPARSRGMIKTGG